MRRRGAGNQAPRRLTTVAVLTTTRAIIMSRGPRRDPPITVAGRRSGVGMAVRFDASVRAASSLRGVGSLRRDTAVRASAGWVVAKSGRVRRGPVDVRRFPWLSRLGGGAVCQAGSHKFEISTATGGVPPLELATCPPHGVVQLLHYEWLVNLPRMWDTRWLGHRWGEAAVLRDPKGT